MVEREERSSRDMYGCGGKGVWVGGRMDMK